jgi:hypothetical protein
MRRISKAELRFALIVGGLLVAVTLVTGDYVMAIVFAAIAALGTTWQLRHARGAASGGGNQGDGNTEHDENHPTD